MIGCKLFSWAWRWGTDEELIRRNREMGGKLTREEFIRQPRRRRRSGRGVGQRWRRRSRGGGVGERGREARGREREGMGFDSVLCKDWISCVKGALNGINMPCHHILDILDGV